MFLIFLLFLQSYAFTQIDKNNYSELKDGEWLLALVNHAYDQELVQTLTEIARESSVKLGVVDISCSDGELIKASFEAGMVP